MTVRFPRIVATLTIGAIAATTPAFAAPSADPSPAVAATRTAAPDAKRDPRVCLIDTVTGSRIPVKTCKLRSQWIAQTGVDPLNQ